MKKKLIISAILVVLLVIVAIVMYKVTVGNKSEQTMGQGFDQKNHLVTEVATTDIVSSITASGTIEINETNTFYSPSEVPIGEVYIEVGDTVKAGDLILTYDTKDTIKELNKSINEKQIDIENSTISLNQIVAPLTDSEKISYEETITSKERAVTSATRTYDDKVSTLDDEKKEVDDAKINMDNYKKLYDDGLESYNTYDSYVKAYDSAVSNLNTLNKDITEAKASINDANVDLANAKKKYEIAKNPLSDASTKADYTQQSNNLSLKKTELAELQQELSEVVDEVRADKDGTILTLEASKNGSVEEGLPLYTYTDYNNLVVSSTVSQYDLSKVKIGQKVEMYTDDAVDKIYYGEIIEIGNEAEETTVNNSTVDVVPVLISINNDDAIKVGFSINVDIMISDSKGVLAVPTTSVITDKDGTFVFLVENEALKKQIVTTGASDESMTEISGLTEGQQVLTTASQTYKDGMTLIEITEAQSSDTSQNNQIQMGMPGGMGAMQGGGMPPSGGGMPSGSGGGNRSGGMSGGK